MQAKNCFREIFFDVQCIEITVSYKPIQSITPGRNSRKNPAAETIFIIFRSRPKSAAGPEER